jgi:nitroreductase
MPKPKSEDATLLQEDSHRVMHDVEVTRLEPLGRMLKALVPRCLRKRARFTFVAGTYFVRLVCGYFYDMKRYYHAASKGAAALGLGSSRMNELRAWIQADVHKIEKGLSLHTPRPGFGQAVVHRLLANLLVYQSHRADDRTAEIAVHTLMAYREFSERNGHDTAYLTEKLRMLTPKTSDLQDEKRAGGVLRVTRKDITEAASIDIDGFVCSRHSIRDFSEDPVDGGLIEEAVRIALATPSACNRQPWRLYAFMHEDDAHRILAYQEGSRGFGDRAKIALIVTCDLASMFSYCERNQAWVDGGMFAMSLVYALHAFGLGSCCLNWSVDTKTDRRLRAVARIPQNEVIIMLIAVGRLREEFSVARSKRKLLGDVLISRDLDK